MPPLGPQPAAQTIEKIAYFQTLARMSPTLARTALVNRLF